MNSKQLNHMMRHPTKWVRFQTTGALPRLIRLDSPLIRLLESIPPRDRLAILTPPGGLPLHPSRRRLKPRTVLTSRTETPHEHTHEHTAAGVPGGLGLLRPSHR